MARADAHQFARRFSAERCEGEVELQKPVVYQQLNGEKREIAGNYVISGDHRVTFSVANYDRKAPLILTRS